MRSPEARRAEAEEYLVAERRAGLKKIPTLLSRQYLTTRSFVNVRAPPRRTARRRENDLRSRTYSESDLATRKRPFTARRVDRDTSDIGKSVANISYLPRSMIDPREKHRDYN